MGGLRVKAKVTLRVSARGVRLAFRPRISMKKHPIETGSPLYARNVDHRG